MNRSNIPKIANTPEDKILLAKLWDKINLGIRKNIFSSTHFLSPRELDMSRYLFGQQEGLRSFGGYTNAERQMLVYMPDYLEDAFLFQEESPITCLRASFSQADSLSHRDFLGALMSIGISRDAIGDICVGSSTCDFFVIAEIAPYILQELTQAGGAKLLVSRIPISDAQVAESATKQIKDTIASLRLDSVIASGFRISRGTAAQYITSGKAAINGLPCEKPDKTVDVGCKISLRGYGKIKLTGVNGLTKKGRYSVIIDRYI